MATPTPQEIERIQPQPGGQEDYFRRPEFEVLFGGVAGPGKTWALVVDGGGFQYSATPLGYAAIFHPDYRAVIFRRKTTELSKLIDEARSIYCRPPINGYFILKRPGDPGPSINVPNGGRLFLCHLQHEDDKMNHHGLEYQFIGFDELTTFTFTQYLYMFHRCRSTIEHIRPRIRATTNPVGPGLSWVKKRFVKMGTRLLCPTRRYWWLQDPAVDDPYQNPQGLPATKNMPGALSRTYIPGKLEENKYVQDLEQYKNQIRAMGRKYAAALLESDWDVFAGDFFEDFGKRLEVTPFEIPKTWRLVGSLDPGWSSPCSFGLSAIDPKGGIWRLFTYYVGKRSTTDHVAAIVERLEAFTWTGGRMPELIVAGHDAFPQESKKVWNPGEVFFEDEFQKYGLHLVKASTARVPGWWAWKNVMRTGHWHYFKGYNDALVEEITAAQHDEDDPEDLLGRGNDPSVFDHALDENRYLVMTAHKTPLPKKVDPFAGRPQWGVDPAEIQRRKNDYRNVFVKE